MLCCKTISHFENFSKSVILTSESSRRRGRVVECAALEMRYIRKGIGGSNPPVSEMAISIKAIIFDWGRTLFDSETKKEFPEAEIVLTYCQERNLRLALVSLVTIHANAGLEERKGQIETSPL